MELIDSVRCRLTRCKRHRHRPVAGLVPRSSRGAQTPAPRPPDPASEKRLEWFREAKYGLFIHWGLYAIPAGEWKGKRSLGLGEWIMNRSQMPVTEYEQLAAQFNPVKFNADEWVQLAQDAGMKYIVITSKHHDGFAMFKSKVSQYNVVDATPFKRDVLKELADACAKRGMRLGFYYSQSQDWHEPDGAGNTWDFGPTRADEKSEGLRRLPARQGRAAGEGAADRLRSGRAHLVRHAAHDDAASAASASPTSSADCSRTR